MVGQTLNQFSDDRIDRAAGSRDAGNSRRVAPAPRHAVRPARILLVVTALLGLCFVSACSDYDSLTSPREEPETPEAVPGQIVPDPSGSTAPNLSVVEGAQCGAGSFALAYDTSWPHEMRYKNPAYCLTGEERGAGIGWNCNAGCLFGWCPLPGMGPARSGGPDIGGEDWLQGNTYHAIVDAKTYTFLTAGVFSIWDHAAWANAMNFTKFEAYFYIVGDPDRDYRLTFDWDFAATRTIVNVVPAETFVEAIASLEFMDVWPTYHEKDLLSYHWSKEYTWPSVITAEEDPREGTMRIGHPVRVGDLFRVGGEVETEAIANLVPFGLASGSMYARLEFFMTLDQIGPTVVLGGPYTVDCQGPTTEVPLDGSGSCGEGLAYSWTASSPDASFDDASSATPTLVLDTSAGCPVQTDVTLTVTDADGLSDVTETTVTIEDTTAPELTCPVDPTLECDLPRDPGHTGFATATDVCDVGPGVVHEDAVSPGLCADAFAIERLWTAIDASGNASECRQTIDVVDTTSPLISCNAPATITPRDVPVSFTAEAADNCSAVVPLAVTDYDCHMLTKKGKRIDKTDGCRVRVDGATITILDSGGVGDQIEWTVQASDDCGNVREQVCELEVVNPGRSGK